MITDFIRQILQQLFAVFQSDYLARIVFANINTATLSIGKTAD